jgi:hypothetical protein
MARRPVKKRDLNLYPGKRGAERADELMDLENSRRMYLPKGISVSDMDTAVYELFERDLRIVSPVSREAVPLHSADAEAWAAFAQTWSFQDANSAPAMPFVIFRCSEPPVPAKTPAARYNIPGGRTYTYLKVPYWDGKKKSYEHYQVPLPVHTDIGYEARIFSSYKEDVNTMDTAVLKFFASIQGYISVNGHPMALRLNGITKSDSKDISGPRYYSNTYSVTLSGHLRDETDYKVVPGIREFRLSYIPKDK